MTSRTALYLVAALGGLAAGCGSANDGQSTATTGQGGGGATGGAGGNAGASGTGGAGGAADQPLPFQPSNVDVAGWDLSNVGDVVISRANSDIYTEQGVWSGVDPKAYVHQLVELGDKSKLSVFVVKSLRVEATVVVRTFEPLPAVVIALEDMTLLGSLLVPPGAAGGAVNSLMNTKGTGPGGGPAGSDTVSGGGASYCGVGGPGVVKAGASGSMPPAAYGGATLIPLLPGSAGGSGAVAPNGLGGGALQLVAGGKLLLGAGAFVSAGGGGGLYGGNDSQQAGGGGSGGAILIEASDVSILGTLAANGAGGGQGLGDKGEDGRADDMPAAGGDNGTGIGPGGAGSAAASLDGATGGTNGVDNPGGGGGAAGRIRINTPTGMVDLSKAIVSPSMTTPCATVGNVAAL